MAQFVDVKIEYAKDKNLKEEDVEVVLNWVNTQPHLPKINEIQAIAFLKKNHYYVEPAKKNVDTYFTVKKIHPDLFVGRNLSQPSFKNLLNSIFFTPLPKKTPDGYTMILMKILSSDIAYHNLSECLKYQDVATMSHLYQHGTSAGYVLVLDVRNLPRAFLPKLNVIEFKRHFYFMQEVIPIHFKGYHFIAHCPFMDELLDVVRSAAPKSLLPFIHVHNSLKDVEKYIPIELLPEDYGGSEESVDVLKEKWEQELQENVALFEWEDQQVINEDKRPSKNYIIEVENGVNVDY